LRFGGRPSELNAFAPKLRQSAFSTPVDSFDSLEHCRKAATTVLSWLGDDTQRDYECGSNCRPYGRSGLNMCDETVK
jgi:hypothetical protein